MKKLFFVALMIVAASHSGAQTKAGKWLDTTQDTVSNKYLLVGEDATLLLTEDYEVVKTHEVCGSVEGMFLNKSQLGRYNVNFKGMRTSATFTFTTRYDAEKWIEKWCTADSLLSIKAGRGEFARKY